MTTTTQQAQPADPFASGDSKPSVSFKDAPHGTSFTLEVTDTPQMVQARDYETGEPAYWPDGNAKMTVVTGVVDKTTGEQKNLWAAKPSAMFAAIAEAQKKAGAQIVAGGTLVVTYTHDKPNEKNPRLNPAKQYTVTYTPPNAFGDQQPAAQQETPAPQQQPAAAASAPQQPAGPTPEQVAAVKAAGLDPTQVFPGYVPQG